MLIDLGTIINVLIAIALYKLVIAAISNAFIKFLLSGDVAQEKKKTFQEKLRARWDEQQSKTNVD